MSEIPREAYKTDMSDAQWDLIRPLLPPPKKIKGRKRHILTDVMGFVIAVVITSAYIDDGNAAPLVLEKISQEQYERLELIWADSKYHNHKLHAWLEQHRPGWRIEVVSKPKDAPPGFVVLPRRWVVERTFARMGRNRRLSKDYERTNSSSEATVWIANISLLMHRLAPKNTQKFNYRA